MHEFLIAFRKDKTRIEHSKKGVFDGSTKSKLSSDYCRSVRNIKAGVWKNEFLSLKLLPFQSHNSGHDMLFK